MPDRQDLIRKRGDKPKGKRHPLARIAGTAIWIAGVAVSVYVILYWGRTYIDMLWENMPD